MVDLLKMRSSHAEVFRFVRDACVRVIPLGLWGSKHNQHIFLRHLERFVTMRRHEAVTSRRISESMRTSDIAWLRNKSNEAGEAGEPSGGAADSSSANSGGAHSATKKRKRS